MDVWARHSAMVAFGCQSAVTITPGFQSPPELLEEVTCEV